MKIFCSHQLYLKLIFARKKSYSMIKAGSGGKVIMRGCAKLTRGSCLVIRGKKKKKGIFFWILLWGREL